MTADPFDDLLPPPVGAPRPDFVKGLRERVLAIEARAGRNGRTSWHLAQLNLGLFRAPLDSPQMTEFAHALERVNALAESSPGFVWRLTDAEGAPSSYVDVPGADDPLVAPNLSVWTDLESLRTFMYRTDHGSYLRRRAEWFVREPRAMSVAWWVRAGSIPTLEEGVARLDHLRDRGPSAEAFPLGRTIPHPPTGFADIDARSANMTTPATNTSQVLVPYLTVGDARRALDFYAEVFGARQTGELFEMDDGRIGHAEMSIDGQVFYMADEFPEMSLESPATVGGNSISMVINVDDCDAMYDHAISAGATGERPPANQHGHRSGWFVDPWGHRWCPTSAAST